MTSQKFIFSVGESFVPKFTALGSFYFHFVFVVTAYFKPSDSKKSHNARLGFNISRDHPRKVVAREYESKPRGRGFLSH